VQCCFARRSTTCWKSIASYGHVRWTTARQHATLTGRELGRGSRINAAIAVNPLELDVRGVNALNREAQERWDDDGGAIPLNLAIQTTGSECSMIDSPALVGASDRTMLLNHLEVVNRYFRESEHSITRQQKLISKLRAKRQTTLFAVEFLRSLQASRVMHCAGRSRLQRALAILDEKLGTIQPLA
jgi:hypothetical protein